MNSESRELASEGRQWRTRLSRSGRLLLNVVMANAGSIVDGSEMGMLEYRIIH